MRLDHLAVRVLEQVGARAVQDAGPAGGHRGGMLPGLDPLARRLDADHPHLGIVEERVEQAHGVRAAADAGDQRVRQAALLGHDLLARLLADHRLEVAHHGGIGMRAGDACR